MLRHIVVVETAAFSGHAQWLIRSRGNFIQAYRVTLFNLNSRRTTPNLRQILAICEKSLESDSNTVLT
jgi:hypothetical protein